MARENAAVIAKVRALGVPDGCEPSGGKCSCCDRPAVIRCWWWESSESRMNAWLCEQHKALTPPS
jgi:hypothetical protein